jgi:hypothetical protein
MREGNPIAGSVRDPHQVATNESEGLPSSVRENPSDFRDTQRMSTNPSDGSSSSVRVGISEPEIEPHADDLQSSDINPSVEVRTKMIPLYQN